MADIRTVPQTVNITHYAGDTLTIRVTVPAGFADGLDWNAHVKAVRTQDTPDAVFEIIQPPAPGDPAYLTLPTEETTRLVSLGRMIQRVLKDGTTRSVIQYSSEWDCQVSAAGDDPVTTLVQGALVLEMDVTRLTP